MRWMWPNTLGMMAAMISLVAAHTAWADPPNMAEEFQATMTPYGWPPPFSPVNRLLASIEPNTQRDWPLDGGPAPDGLPPDAVRVVIFKSYSSEMWNGSCTELCFSEYGNYHVDIYFADSSDYFYEYAWDRKRCIDTGDSSEIRSLEVSDTSNINNMPGRLGHFTIRNKRTSDSATIHTSESSIDLRSPAAAGESFQPPNNLHTIAPPGAAAEFRGGPGSTLDLRGFSPSSPVLIGQVPAQIYADSILLSPGVTLASIFSPPPVVHPGEDIHDLRTALARYPKETPPGTSICRVNVRNFGNQPEVVNANWSDTSGWVLPGVAVTAIPQGGEQTFAMGVAMPPSATACDRTELTFAASSSTGAQTSFQLRIFGPGDLDNDGIANSADNAPLLANPTQSDADQDMRGDVVDNCLSAFNPFQQDSNQNGVGDACEPDCLADFNLSGSLSVQDIFDFLAAYFGNDPRADFNASGAISVQDIFDFLAAYFGGCP